MNGWDNSVLTDAIANCLVENTSGVVESCSSFSTTNSPTAANACTERSPVYPCEKVHGILASLPGCRTSGAITSCPGGVEPSCAANYATIGRFVSPGNSQYSSIGCYTEATTGRALPAKTYTDPIGLTVDTCLAFCSGYKYAGVEYGQEVRRQYPSTQFILMLTMTNLVLLRQYLVPGYVSCLYWELHTAMQGQSVTNMGRDLRRS